MYGSLPDGIGCQEQVCCQKSAATRCTHDWLTPAVCVSLQWCDAKGQPCIIIEQDASGSNRDVVVVDLAPLRSSSLLWAVERSLGLADAAGARRIEPAERPLHAVPFDTIPVDLPLSVEQVRLTILTGIVAAGAVAHFEGMTQL